MLSARFLRLLLHLLYGILLNAKNTTPQELEQARRSAVSTSSCLCTKFSAVGNPQTDLALCFGQGATPACAPARGHPEVDQPSPTPAPLADPCGGPAYEHLVSYNYSQDCPSASSKYD